LVWPKHLFPQDYFPTDVRLAGKSLVFNRELAQKIYEQFFKVRLAADATVDIATILPYPFIMLAILFISQTPIFDDWRWSMTQIIIMGLSLSAILASAFFLQRVASSIRKHALKTLDRLVLFPGKAVAAGANVPIAPSIRALAEYVRNRIESVDSGAYRPFSKSPIVSAILIPATSIGASYGAPELLRWFSNWL
jgi:hypothetical protein